MLFLYSGVSFWLVRRVWIIHDHERSIPSVGQISILSWPSRVVVIDGTSKLFHSFRVGLNGIRINNGNLKHSTTYLLVFYAEWRVLPFVACWVKPITKRKYHWCTTFILIPLSTCFSYVKEFTNCIFENSLDQNRTAQIALSDQDLSCLPLYK